MIFFRKSGNSKSRDDQYRRQKRVFDTSAILFLLPSVFIIVSMFLPKCKCIQLDSIVKKVKKVDNSRPHEVMVKSHALTVKSFDRRLEERGAWKSSLLPKLLEEGRIETITKSSARNSNISSTETGEREDEESPMNKTPATPVSTTPLVVNTTEETIFAESQESNESDGNEAPIPYKKDTSPNGDDNLEDIEENVESAEEIMTSKELERQEVETSDLKFNTSPKTTARTIKPTPTLKLIAKSVRTTYPFLKKVPARLVAKPVPATKSTTPAPVTKRVTTKKPTKRIKLTQRPATPVPEHYNPHHPHGVVVFDKRKRRPKPGRSTTTATTTTSTTTRKPIIHTTTTTESEYDSFYDSDDDEDPNTPTDKVNNTSSKKKPGKIPLSKLAIAMIASSTNFDNGSKSDEMAHYPKTPINLLYLLQAYTKQMQLANAEKVEALTRPVRIQSTPFMLHLNQLNFAAKLGISIYYSLIAIIPLIYLAFGGLGRMGFLNGVIGKRRRRKRSTFDDEYFYGEEGNGRNYKKFNRRTHFQIHAKGGGGIRRGDLRDDDGNEEEYAWILSRISEIMLEFSMIPNEGDKK